MGFERRAFNLAEANMILRRNAFQYSRPHIHHVRITRLQFDKWLECYRQFLNSSRKPYWGTFLNKHPFPDTSFAIDVESIYGHSVDRHNRQLENIRGWIVEDINLAKHGGWAPSYLQNE